MGAWQRPWVWLYVLASLVAVVNIAVARSTFHIYSEEWGFVVIGATLGLIFGHVGLAALWAAWGPSHWLNNYAIAGGSLCWLVAISWAGTFLSDDEESYIVLVEAGVIVFLFPIQLAILHIVRYSGRWRLLSHDVNEPGNGPVQVSLRGILIATTFAAALFALARLSHQYGGFRVSLNDFVDLALISGEFSLLIGPTLVAPCLLFFAVLHRRWLMHYVVLAIVLGYLLPAVIVFWLLDFDVDDFFRTFEMLIALVPLQLGAVAAACLGFGMLHGAGMRLKQVARKTVDVQRSAVGS